MKRKWLMIPLVTGILAAGLTGASVLAHNEDGEQVSPKDAVVAKVAESLGLDQQILKDALQEAIQEVRSDRIQHRLVDAVEAGRLTQEQADAYLEWYEARPEGLDQAHRLFKFGRGGDGGPSERFGGRGFGGSHRFGGQDFQGQGQLPSGPGGDGGPSERFGGRGFGESHRFGGQNFQRQGQLPSGPGGDVPEGSGTSY